jgi:adenylyltransferase/sulfurtransferase
MKEITVSELKEMMDNKEDFQLIDVREQNEYDFVNLNAELIPLGQFMDNIEKIATDKKVIVHCRSGARSANAILQLQATEGGYENLYNLKGGILAWSDQIDPSKPKY